MPRVPPAPAALAPPAAPPVAQAPAAQPADERAAQQAAAQALVALAGPDTGPVGVYTGASHGAHEQAANAVSFPTKGKIPPPIVNPAGHRIGEGYEPARARPSSEALPRLQDMTPDQRLNVLDGISQNDDLLATNSDEDRCGAATLTAASLYADGERGLSALITAAEAFNQAPPLNGRVDLSMLGEVRQKLASGQALNHGDISRVQHCLYEVIHSYKAAIGRGDDPGLSNRVIAAFLEAPGSAAVRGHLDSQHIAIRHIDNDGDGGGNHFVMMVPAQAPTAVYDPYARSDGHQVSRSPERVRDYVDAVDPRSGRTYN